MQLQWAYLSCQVRVTLLSLAFASPSPSTRGLNLMSGRRSPMHRNALILALCILQSLSFARSGSDPGLVPRAAATGIQNSRTRLDQRPMV